MKIIQSVLLAVIIGLNFILAGVSGKISGKITDQETGEGLTGVNIILTGTSLGVATDADGYYVILNVPPGDYSLNISMIGYNRVEVTAVKVVVDRTTTIDASLVPEVIGMEGVTIVAERKPVVVDVAASQLYVSSETIEALPVNDVNTVIGMQAGIQDGLVIRGGASRQTTYMVDGFIMNDSRSNIPFTAVSLSSINDLLVQTGGFSAEYGNTRSGIVNISTREGDPDHYHGTLIYQHRPPAAKHFGLSVYHPDTYFLRPYTDPEVCFIGTHSPASPWDVYQKRQYPKFQGWNSVANQTLMDDDPSNDLTPEGAKHEWEFQHRRQGDIVKPDYTIDFGFGGPLPGMGAALGNMRFYASYRDIQEMFVIPLSQDSYSETVGRLKLTSDLSSDMKLSLITSKARTESVSPYNWTTTPTGQVLRSDYEIANLVGSSSGNSLIYMPGWYSPTTIDRMVMGVNFNHILNDKTYYTVFAQHNINDYLTYQIEDRDTAEVYQIVDGYYVDEAPYGYWGYGVGGKDGMRLGGWMNLGRDTSVVTTSTLKLDLTTQLNPTNEIKTGFIYVRERMDINSGATNPGMTTWNRSQVYDVSPIRFEAYLLDKLEYKGFIANIGLRAEYSNSAVSWYDLAIYDKYYKEYYGHLIEDEAPTIKSQPDLSLNPRLAISHPITDNSKLYFNYGHFHTEPASSYRFRLQREYSGLVTSIGDPNLERERTISYELGYVQAFQNDYLLSIAGYYKDVTAQPGWIDYYNLNSSVQYSKPDNNNYEDIRGLEITMEKRKNTRSWLSGFVNYTYMVSTSGYFGLLENWEDPNKQREYLRNNPVQEKPRPQPYARANLDLAIPKTFGPSLLGRRFLGGWSANMLFSWRAGRYTTWNPDNQANVLYNVRWKDTYRIDLRLKKDINIGQTKRVQLYVDIDNLLNTKFLSYAGFADTYDYRYYMESLMFDDEKFGQFKGSDRVGEYREENTEFIPLITYEDVSQKSDLYERAVYYDQLTERYLQYENDAWVERSKGWIEKNVIEPKAYIDMPNLTYFTFLNPRDITIGLTFSF